MNKNDDMTREFRIAMFLVLCRLPQFLLTFLAASLGGSVVLWLEFVEAASIVIPGAILAMIALNLSKNLKYEFNYGTGKVEAITALGCEMFDIAGILAVVVIAIREVFKEPEEEGLTEIALVISIIGLLIDIFILYKQRNIAKANKSRMFHTAYLSARKEFGFDLASIITLIVTIIFRETGWIRYVSPAVCVVVAIPFLIVVTRSLRGSVLELIDKTLDEEIQLKILKVINEHFESYEALGDINSRETGHEYIIDIEMKFSKTTTYAQIHAMAEKIRQRMNQEIGKSTVNIIII